MIFTNCSSSPNLARIYEQIKNYDALRESSLRSGRTMVSARSYGFWRDRASSAEPESALFMKALETSPSLPFVESAMKWLSGSDSTADLCELISNLTFVRLMQDEKRIIPEDLAQVSRANDVSIWMPMMEEYVSFVCTNNPYFPPEYHRELLQGSAAYYREHLKVLMDDLAYDLDGWKEPFESGFLSE